MARGLFGRVQSYIGGNFGEGLSIDFRLVGDTLTMTVEGRGQKVEVDRLTQDDIRMLKNMMEVLLGREPTP